MRLRNPRKADPISQRAQTLTAEIAALQAQIRQLDLLCLMIALLVSQLANLAPARRAAQVNIIQALKHE